MNKKWLVIPSLVVLMLIGAVAAMPVLQRLWEEHRPGREVVIDRAMQVEVIDKLVAKLKDHYVFPDKAKQIEAVLRRRQQEGKYDGLKNGYRLANQLRADIRGVSKDLHMKVWFAPGLDIPGERDGPEPASQAEWEERNNVVKRLMMRHEAARYVKKARHLSHNIGYLKITGFPSAYPVAEKYAAAMNELAGTDGLIVDLRDNGGGEPGSVALLISYFVDGRTRLNDIWNRDTGTTTQHWTHDKLDGKRYGGKKPVLILVGPGTASAAEDFAYTMQALKRATVVGERTWGGAHPSSLHRINDYFLAVIPNERTISPITGTNWEGVGVKPDIAATPDKALAVAKEHIRRRLQGSAPRVAAGINARPIPR